jgi:hypothetical protein
VEFNSRTQCSSYNWILFMFVRKIYVVDRQNLRVNKLITTPRQFIDCQVTLSSGKCQSNKYYFRCHINQPLYYITKFSVQHSFLAPKTLVSSNKRIRHGQANDKHNMCVAVLVSVRHYVFVRGRTSLVTSLVGDQSCDELGGRFI